MAEVPNGGNGARKRRLPLWMQGVSASDNPSCVNKNDDCMVTMVPEEHSETKAARYKIKSTAGELGPTIPDIEANGSKRIENSLGRESKRRMSKASRSDIGPSNSIISSDEASLPKSKLKKEPGGRPLRKRAASKKQNQKFDGLENSDVESRSQESSGNEIELTVEDLMSIAHEYINADGKKQHGRSTARESNSEKHTSSCAVSFNADLGGLSETTGCNQALSRCTTTMCNSGLSEIGRKEKEIPPTKKFGSNSMYKCTTTSSSYQSAAGWKEKEIPGTETINVNIRTGDAAKDMLDLFLGPLLKNPPTEELDLKMAKAETRLLVHESDKQTRSIPGWKEVASQGSMAMWKEDVSQVRSMAEWKEEVPLTKKKSSLKDKVSMFLD